MNFKLWLEVNEVVMPELFKKLKQLPGEYSGVHFSKMNQLSFNINPPHWDPIGIYVFPKKYILEGGLSANTMFASYPYAFLIEPTDKAKILNLDMDLKKAEILLEKMGIDKDLLYSKEVYHRSGQETPGHKFWGAMENFRNTPRNFKNLGKNISWNSLFAKTGYNTLYDPGLRIVHTNEPAQVIYMDHKAYKVVDIIKNLNKHSLLVQFASYFPDFRMYKKRSSWSKDEYVIRLKKDEIEITTWTSKNDPNKIGVKVYGFGERYSSKEWYFVINSLEDLVKSVGEVKSFMESSTKTEPLPKQDYSFMDEVSRIYNLKMDPKYPGDISKKYRDASFALKYAPNSKDNVTLQVESRSLWARYFYYSSAAATEPEETINKLITELKEKIKEDLDDENSRKKYDAPHAMRFVGFLEKRVFVRRKK